MRDFMQACLTARRQQCVSNGANEISRQRYGLILVLSLLAVTGCGRNVAGTEFLSSPSSPVSPVSTPTPAVSAVSLACSAPTVGPDGTTQCNATVQGTEVYTSAVSWSASAGAINSNGLLTAPPSPGTITVTATSIEDPTKSASANVTVQTPQASAPIITFIAAGCHPSTVAPNATSQCDATVQGTGSFSSAVRWSASEGAIDANGIFTAPAATGSVMVTATSVQDSTKFATATVAVSAQPAPSSVTAVVLACNPSPVDTNASSQCSATVQGMGDYDPAVQWFASAGSIDANGRFTAPASPGIVKIIAASKQDPTKSASASLSVQPTGTTPAPPVITSLAAVCNPSAVKPNATSQCVASVQGTGSYSSAVNWSASAGSIGPNGGFTAPASTGTVTVTATSQQDTTKSAKTLIAISTQSVPSSITSVLSNCSPSSIATGASSQCSATVQGTGSYNSAVKWFVNAGSINANGLFLAPASAGNVVITATSLQDTSKFGSTNVTVQPAPPAISSVGVACNSSTLAPGATSLCIAAVQGIGAYSSSVRWSASAGSINSNGLFSAPSSSGTVTITATSIEDGSKSGSAAITVQPQQPPTLQSRHVVIVMEENESYSTVIGSGSSWPNLNNLAANGAQPTNYYADTHPSIGNYLMLTTGQVLTNDDNSTTVWNVDNLARRMLAGGVSFRIYAEGISQGYLGGNTGAYLLRHNPFALLSDIADSSQVANQHLFPFTQFAADVAGGTLPEFSFIVPDVNDDAHNGTPQQADAWLQTQVVAPLSGYSAFGPGGDGVLFVTFDEAATSDSSYGGGHVASVLWGPAVKVGYTQTSSTVYQHQSELRTVMELLGLPNPPGAAASAPAMTEFFK